MTGHGAGRLAQRAPGKTLRLLALPQREDRDRGFTGKAVREGRLWGEVVGPIGHRVSFTKGARSPITYWLRDES